MIDRLEGGGAQKVLFNIIKNLSRDKFEIHLFSLLQEGYYSNQIPVDVFHWSLFHNPENMPKGFSFLYRFYRRILFFLFRQYPSLIAFFVKINQNYDFGISFCEGYNTSLLKFKKNHFKKTIAWVHIDICLSKEKIAQKCFQNYSTSFDEIFFVSNDAYYAFIKKYPQFERKTHLKVVYNPIDVDEIVLRSNDYVVGDNEFVLLAIGRLSEQKRFDKLINVHKRLVDSGLMHCVWILGEGDKQKELEDQIKRLEVENTCILLGFQNPYPYLKRADIFVMTSDYEGLPVVICEAMILHKPILSTKITGSVELLENGKYGMLVEKEEEAIFRGLSEMLMNKELRDHYSLALQENKDSFIFPTTTQSIEDLLLFL